MKISFICNHIYLNNGWSPWDTRIGGSEEMIVEASKRLAKNHKVEVFHNGRHGNYEGVEYLPHDSYLPSDVTINVNYPEFRQDTKQILWTSLTDHPELDHFAAVCVISQYARDNTHIKHPNVHIVPPGYDETKVFPGKKILKQCFYASSPDRGLDILLEAWPSVYQEHPDATLLITYGATSNLPGVISMGEVDEETMNEIYKTSDIWCHPAIGNELYCMTGVKAQAAGCVPVVIPHMALAETVRHGYKLVSGDFGQMLIQALSDDRSEVRKDLIKEHYPTWDDCTNMLEELIKSVQENKNGFTPNRPT